MKLERELGGYSRWVTRLYGSFKTNGTGAPDTFRDGHSGLIKSVVRDSAGHFTVTLADTLKQMPFTALTVVDKCHITTADPPVKVCQANIVTDSWNTSTKTFKIIVMKTGTVGGAAAAPVEDDPDSGVRIGFELLGSISSVGKDAA